MPRLARAGLVVVLCIQVFAAAAWGGVRDDVERLIRHAPLKGGVVAVSIVDMDSGRTLVSINDQLPMTPASNMKLLSSGAALHALGPNFEFTTRLVRDGDRLIVIGDGDPAFGDPELLKDMTLGESGRKGVDVETFISLWIKPVVESGMTSISELVVDDRIFDRETALNSWPGDEPNRYCPQVSGFNFHGNVLHFLPKPRKGQPPELGNAVPLAPWLKITNAATSRDGSQDKNDLWIARKNGTNDLTFRGNVRFAYKSPVELKVHDMPGFFAQLLQDRLEKAGVKVARQRVSDKTDPASAGAVIGPVICTPLSTILTRCNRDSDNLYAECLVKRIAYAMTGEPGSWTNGTSLVRHIIHRRLSDPTLLNGVVIMDGSGLSASNKVTAKMMTAWLNSIGSDEALGTIFIESLAIGGQTGTIKGRMASAQMKGATVYAKTGYINQVSCLSGYVVMPNGRKSAFSVLCNNLKEGGTVAAAKKLQDQIVAAIAEEMSAPTVKLGSD